MSCLRVAIRFIFLLLLFLFSVPSYSQDWQVRYLGIDKGLSNNLVNSIFQDHNGLMWFGTYDGLNRYDGYEFTIFRNIIGDSTSLFSNNVNSIGEDEKHNIWIGGQKEVNIYNPLIGRFSIPSYTFADGRVSKRLSDNVVSVQLIQHNTVLAGTQQNGLFYFDNTTGHGKQVPIGSRNSRTVNYYVNAIAYSAASQQTYVFVQNKGLFTYDPQRHTLTLKSDAFLLANSIAVSKERDILLGDFVGLYKLNTASGAISQNLMPVKASVVDLCEDKAGNVWIATDGNGVWVLQKGKSAAVPLAAISPDGKSPVNSNAVYALYEDNQQRKWIGTLRGGVNVIEPRQDLFRKVEYTSDSNATANNFIFCFAEDNTHNLWIGTDGAGLRYWNRTNNSFTNYTRDSSNPKSLSSNFITSILNDSTGLWISTWFGGINRFDKATKTFRRYDCYKPAAKAEFNNVWTLLRDSKGRLWASSVRGGGLFLYNTATDKFDLFDDKLIDLQSLAEDREGNLWGGDYTSLFRIDAAGKQHKSYHIGYAVRSIYEDKKKRFWIGTQEGGLLLFNRSNGTFKRFTTSNGLPHNTVLNILEDSTGNLWMSTYNGLSRFNPDKGSFQNFSTADGLQSNQFSFHGALALSSGEMAFGGIEGFNLLNPKHIAQNPFTPPLFLSDIFINNSPVQDHPSYVSESYLDAVRKVTIPYNEASLSLTFLGLDYTDADKLDYAYYLKGWDKNWVSVKNIRTANYSRLQEGDYVFEVKVSRANGKWSAPAQLLHIVVLPPWYRSWWAYLLYVLFALAVIYLYNLYRNRQVKLRYEVKLAQLETRQEKELNEKKIAFFTNVSHEFRAPLSLIINPIKDLLQTSGSRSEKAELKIVYRNAQRLLRLVDHLLLFKKAEVDDALHLTKLNVVNVLQYVFDCFTEQGRLNEIDYRFQCELSQLCVQGDREKIEIIFFNVLSNAFKHTPRGGSVLFTIEEENSKAKVTIRDTGSGIPEEEGEKLFRRFYQVKSSSQAGFGIGLYLVKTFVDAHQGDISYTSEVGKGTAFVITFDAIEAGVSADKKLLTNDDNNAVVETDAGAGKNILEDSGEDKQAANADVAVTSSQETFLAETSKEKSGDEEQSASPEKLPQELTTEKPSLLLIDDDAEILHYLVSLFKDKYRVYKADCAEDGIKIAHEQLPDLIISDIVMKGLNGIDLCRTLKEDDAVKHIPVILLTGTSSDEIQLKAMETGADDYIKKPFDKDLLAARVKALLKRRSILQEYFYNEVTLGTANYKVSAEYKEFLQKCMTIIEAHFDDDQFSIKTLATEMGMSHSNLYKKVKSVSGQTVSGFIKFIRLRKAAEILINTESNVNETAGMVGFNDTKYFRIQFSKQFGMPPSEYIKKYRKSFHNIHSIDDQLKK